jgi:SH3-like domain-containing protein
MLSCRHGLTVLLAAFLALGSSRADAQQMVSIAAEEVNFRSGPGQSHPAEWVLGKGFPLKIVGRRGDWLHVTDFENDKGWVLRKLTSSTAYHIVKVKIANLRSQPTTTSRIVGKFAYGDTLQTLERRGGWVKVQREGLRGWISRKLLWGW